MPVLMVGDQVRWIRGVSLPEYQNAIGTVELVIPNDTGVEECPIYDIRFLFGTRTLYGTQTEVT